jgi:hypothetical protein
MTAKGGDKSGVRNHLAILSERLYHEPYVNVELPGGKVKRILNMEIL